MQLSGQGEAADLVSAGYWYHFKKMADIGAGRSDDPDGKQKEAYRWTRTYERWDGWQVTNEHTWSNCRGALFSWL